MLERRLSLAILAGSLVSPASVAQAGSGHSPIVPAGIRKVTTQWQ